MGGVSHRRLASPTPIALNEALTPGLLAGVGISSKRATITDPRFVSSSA